LSSEAGKQNYRKAVGSKDEQSEQTGQGSRGAKGLGLTWGNGIVYHIEKF